MVQFLIKMNLLDLPDEILVQVCDYLNVDDILSLFHIPQFALKAKGYFTFYYDENSQDAVDFVQKMQGLSAKAYPIREFKNTRGLRTGIVHFLLGDPSKSGKQRDAFDQVFSIALKIPNKVTALTEKLSMGSILTLQTLLFPESSKTNTICFLSLKKLYLERDVDIDPRKLKFPKVEDFTLEFCETKDHISKFNLPNAQEITIVYYSRDIHKSLIENFKFDDYSHLKKVYLFIVIEEDGEEVKDAKVCDFEGVSFGTCKFLSISIREEFNYFFKDGTGVLKNLNMIPKLTKLQLKNFSSIINFDAPHLRGLSVDIDFDERIHFENFNAPKLLKISTSGGARDGILPQELKNIYAPKLQSVDLI